MFLNLCHGIAFCVAKLGNSIDGDACLWKLTVSFVIESKCVRDNYFSSKSMKPTLELRSLHKMGPQMRANIEVSATKEILRVY